MKKIKIKLNYKKERVVLSDILPYEIPVIISNRHLYNFLIENKVEFDLEKEIVTWQFNSIVLDEVIKLLFGLNKIIESEGANRKSNIKYESRKIPFGFKISHKTEDFRELSIIHPINQLHLVNLYDKYKELIKYYSNISPFSIRKPHCIAKFKFRNDFLHKLKLAKNSDNERIEVFEKEYENLKTFFTYKTFSSIHKFFESHMYQENEKKYNYLFKIDIGKFFDSIYTHSIAWALNNKSNVKDNLHKKGKTFADYFDKFMSNCNYGETNGILIGSEFARIFAELILQQIDKTVYLELEKEKVYHKKEYTIFRYVDDYFIFFNEEIILKKILELFRVNLKEYKLHISDSKSILYNKPIITELTIAKTKVINLFSNNLKIRIPETTHENLNKKWHVYFSANKVITLFKIIIKETNIEYKDILPLTLGLIEKQMNKVIFKFEKEDDKGPYLKEVLKFNYEILQFSFFIYSVSPRVSATIKMTSIVSKMVRFFKVSKAFNSHHKSQVYKKIFDESIHILDKNKMSRFRQVESLYLLIILNMLPKEYRLNECFLVETFFLNSFEEKVGIKSIDHNYFVIITLMFYIKNIKRYSGVKDKLLLIIKDKFEKDNLEKDTELILLLFDLLACPYVDTSFKYYLLSKFDVNADHADIINFCSKKSWFTKWDNFDLIQEIEAKKSQEVYS